MTIEELYQIILGRKKNLPENSYVASLFKKGNDRIIQKVGEEAIEVVVAAKNENKQKIILEVSDLLFHTVILLANFDITLVDVLNEFEKRKK